jgi:hypothetical protein
VRGVDQHLPNPRQHHFQFLDHLGIPETQNAKSIIPQYSGSGFVLLFIHIVLPAVQFDDETTLKTTEIHNIPFDGLLTSESESPEAARTQMSPKDPFDVCLTATVSSG